MICSVCQEEKPSDFFYKYRSKCKDCIYARQLFIQKEKWGDDYVSKKAYMQLSKRVKHRYGITFDDANKLLIEQNNKCKICKINIEWQSKERNNTACIDHCHLSDEVRGILCHKCNLALGLFNDSLELMSEAIDYLKLYKEN